MCGIGSITISEKRSRPVDLTAGIEAMLEELEARGGHATGLMALDSAYALHVQKASVKAKEFIRDMTPIPSDTLAVAVHTRFATKGAKEWPKNNHPVQHASAWLLHNGVVDDSELERVKGDPWVDTFALSAAFSACGQRTKGETPRQYAKRVGDALAAIDGSAAIVCALEGVPVMITARLHGSPLYYVECDGVRLAASTRKAIEDAADAMDLEVPAERHEITIVGKKGKQSTRVEYREKIEMAEEGRVLSWQDGKHNRLVVNLPERTYKKPWRAPKSTTYQGGEGYGLYAGQGYTAPRPNGYWHNGKFVPYSKPASAAPAQAPPKAQAGPVSPQYPAGTPMASSPEGEQLAKLFHFWRLSGHGVKWAQKHPQAAHSYDDAVTRARQHATRLPFPTPRELMMMQADPLLFAEESEAEKQGGKLPDPLRPHAASASFVGDSCGVVSVSRERNYDASLSVIVEEMLRERGSEHDPTALEWRRCDLCNFECDDVEDYADGALCSDCARLWTWEGKDYA